ncbi:Putative adenylate kinase [uncultured archaeon]|nr:Putative adenylate kinase [uncultured archaeon]
MVSVRLVAVSGSPGVGKSALCRLLGESGFNDVDLTALVKKEGLGVRDRKRDALAVDVDVLEGALKEKIRGSSGVVVLDGLLSHHLPVERVVVVRCDALVLAGRLKARKYSSEKIRENVEAEFLGVILEEALGKKVPVLEVDVTKEIDFKRVAGWVKNKGETNLLSLDMSESFSVFLGGFI